MMDLKSSTTGLLAIMIYNLKFSAQVVELVDTRDLKSLEGDFRAGSSPALGTKAET